MKKVLLLLANGFEVLEAGAFTDVIGWNLFEGDRSTSITSVGLHPTLKCTWGFSCVPDKQLSQINLDDYDALAIPGGFEEAGFFEDAFSEEFLVVIRHFDQRNKPIASICVAALAIGKSGVLANREATTYTYLNNQRQAQLEELGVKLIKNRPIVIDKNIITSRSPATAIDVAFLLLEELTDKKNVLEVKQRMGFTD